MLTIPTFVIGLGGVGNAVVRLLRERFLTTESDGVPESVFLRSIDTATETNQATHAAHMPAGTYTKLGDFNAGQVVTHLDNYPLVKNWWKYPAGTFIPGFIDQGAGARRPVGRLCFFQQFQKIHDALQADFKAAISVDRLNLMAEKGMGEDVARTPRVFIVGSLAGGTCSGMFIDTAILARALLIKAGYVASGTRIAGMFAMPSVIHLASRDTDTVTGRQRRINAFGALRELDYIQSMKNQLIVTYPDPIGVVRTHDALYNMLMLFTDTKHGGSAFSSQHDVLVRAAHALYAQIARGTRDNLTTVMDNVKDFLDPSQQHTLDGSPATYCTFGVEWLEIPRQQLLKTWCREIAAAVGKAVCDFDWEHNRQIALASVIQKNLPKDFKAYSTAFRLRGATPEDLLLMPEMSAYAQLLADIAASEKPAELAKALERFDIESPGIGKGVAHACGRLPDASAEVEWLDHFCEHLISSHEFRMGGARRVLTLLADKLDAIATAPQAPAQGRDEIERECRTGFMGKKVDAIAAIQWARERAAQVTFEQFRGMFGDQAARFSQQCALRISRLAHLQDLVRQESDDLQPARLTSRAEAPPETWLIEPESITQAVATNLEDVKAEVAQMVSVALARSIAEPSSGLVAVPADEDTREMIRRLVIEAIEIVAVRKTKRPADTADRLQRRMTACSPLVHMVDDEVELIEIMGRNRRPVRIKMVVSGMEPGERAALDAWATAEKERAGNENAFQVIASDDPLRDDVLNVEIGWPLCLMREVKNCARVHESVRSDEPHQVAFTLTMKELVGVEQHDFMPPDRGRIHDMFAIAWALQALTVDVYEHTVKFEESIFGVVPTVRLSEDEGAELTMLLRKALEWFRRNELLTVFERHFEKQQGSGRAAFRDTLQRAVKVKRSNIAELSGRPELAALLEELAGYCNRADMVAHKIVDL